MRCISVITVLLIGIIMISGLYAAELHEGHKIKIVKKGSHFRLGVVVKSLEQEKLDAYQLKGGAEVVKVLPNSAAEEIGLKKDDVIIEFDGQEIREASRLHEVISEIEESKEVNLEILREGKKVKLKAMLKPQEDKDFLLHLDEEDFNVHLEELKELPHIIKKKIKIISQKGGFLGIRGSGLSDQLKEYFEVDNGVLIKEVIEDTPADSVGLKAGDVITKINNKEIEDYQDLIRALNYYDPGETVNIKYSRKGKSKEVKVTLKEKEFGHHGFKWMGGGGEEVIIDEIPDIHIEHEKMMELKEELEDIEIDIDIYFI
jgi:C-terminal processing protease CtpA/Prc